MVLCYLMGFLFLVEPKIILVMPACGILSKRIVVFLKLLLLLFVKIVISILSLWNRASSWENRLPLSFCIMCQIIRESIITTKGIFEISS